MDRIICQSCHKLYDYEKDDFCPKCGSYNPPAECRSTPMERELLARFAGGQTQQTPVRTPASGRSAVDTRFLQPQFKPTGVGAAAEGERRHSVRINGCNGCEEPGVKTGPPWILVVVVILIVAIGVALLLNLEEGMGGRRAAAPIPDGAFGGVPTAWEYPMGTEFSLNGVNITVDDLWWQDLSSIPSYEQEGYRCLAVSVYITGGKREDNLAIATPRIELENAAQYPLDHDSAFAYAQVPLDIYNITLSDYQWEPELLGQFVFFLPEAAAGTAYLVLDEYAPGNVEDPTLSAIHRVALELPKK